MMAKPADGLCKFTTGKALFMGQRNPHGTHETNAADMAV
ncbi:hypothetical protein L911_1102 [Vibrio fluvialis I21563]|nr:hypothetical protein L911_1102 [Vibrio fluvialis I21563]